MLMLLWATLIGAIGGIISSIGNNSNSEGFRAVFATLGAIISLISLCMYVYYSVQIFI